jgi:outer membrane protein assembly factor BamB
MRTSADPVPLVVALAAILVGAIALGWLVAGLAAGPTAPDLASGGPAPEPINEAFPGLTTFRGNAGRSYLGTGPVPLEPVKRWVYPVGGKLCSFSAEGRDPSDTKEWCGTGWTGQPNVVPGADGMEVRIGAFDGAYHFLDAGTGTVVRPPLVTGDLAKGSATSDPDGFPLYYGGSRDNLFRVVALDREEPTVLWELDANDARCEGPCWNDDWDGAALVVDDHLLEGGENGWFYVVRLSRGYDAFGQVVVDPETVATFPGYDERLLADLGGPDAVVDGTPLFDVSIENSPVLADGVVYFANSGGLVQGWDVSDVLAGGDEVRRVFRFWTGDDTDATLVMDDEGYLYVASELQRFNDRARGLGQLLKLDPRRSDDPVVWRLPAREIGFQGAGGSWSTPALSGDVVYLTTAAGRVLAVDRGTGDVLWEEQVGAPTITSPVVVDDVLLVGDCTGHLSAWDVSEPADPPPLLWSLDLGDCIESTPAVWDGWLYVGTREGYIYGIADAETPAPAR